MVLAALADTENQIAAAPYRVLADWQRHYGGNLLIVLPDAFGTAHFLANAPDWVADWTGFRPDSGPTIAGGEQIIAWWQAHGRDPRDKLLIFSDGMDVDSIERTYQHFHGRVRMSFGWGTNLTNDFRDCSPSATIGLEPISLVAKAVSANGRPAVKLSEILPRLPAIRRRSHAISKFSEQRVGKVHRYLCECKRAALVWSVRQQLGRDHTHPVFFRPFPKLMGTGRIIVRSSTTRRAVHERYAFGSQIGAI